MSKIQGFLVLALAAVRLPEETLRSVRAQYLCLRTDDGAPFLARVAGQSWFAESYERFVSVPAPWGPRELMVYRRRSPSE